MTDAVKRVTVVDLPLSQFEDLLQEYSVSWEIITPGLFRFYFPEGRVEEFLSALQQREEELLGPFLERFKSQA
jgi:hypothetical protein